MRRALVVLAAFGACTPAWAYEADQDWYDAVRPNLLALDADHGWADPILASMEAAEAEWPPAVHPDVIFVVGDFGTGGTVAAPGLLLGAEFYTAPDDATRDALDDWHRAVVARPAHCVPRRPGGGGGPRPPSARSGVRERTLVPQQPRGGLSRWAGRPWRRGGR